MARESRRSDIETGCSALGSNRRCDAARVVGVLKSTGDCRGLKRRCSAPHACSPRGAAPPHPPMRPRATRAPPIGRFAPCHRPRGRTRPSQRQGRCASFGAATPPLDPGALGRMHQDRCPCAREHGPPTRERWPRQPQTKSQHRGCRLSGAVLPLRAVRRSVCGWARAARSGRGRAAVVCGGGAVPVRRFRGPEVRP